MPIEESLARIASALEVIADKLDNPLMAAKASPIVTMGAKTETISDPGIEATGTSDTGTGELEIKETTTGRLTESKGTIKEQSTEQSKPKFDFNKEIRAPFVELLNLARDKASIGAKGATQLARKLLLEYTTDPNSPLSAKTLPEDKYEEFLAALAEHTEHIKSLEGA